MQCHLLDKKLNYDKRCIDSYSHCGFALRPLTSLFSSRPLRMLSISITNSPEQKLALKCLVQKELSGFKCNLNIEFAPPSPIPNSQPGAVIDTRVSPLSPGSAQAQHQRARGKEVLDSAWLHKDKSCRQRGSVIVSGVEVLRLILFLQRHFAAS